YEVLAIEAKEGRVKLRYSNAEPFEIRLPQPNLGPPGAISIELRQADLPTVIAVYQRLAKRTVLRSISLDSTTIDATIEAATLAEGIAALERAFAAKDLVLEHRGDRFCLMVGAHQAPALKLIPDCPPFRREAPARTGAIAPPAPIPPAQKPTTAAPQKGVPAV